MESGQRRPRKGRKLGSTRRWQTREPADGQDAPGAPAPESWTSQAAAEVQGFLQVCGAQDRGFVTRDDLAVAKFSFLGSQEEPERIFDWVDMEQRGRLSLDEFSSGLKSILGSTESSPGLQRRRLRASLRRGPEPEEADAQEKEDFSTFMEQWGTGPSFPECDSDHHRKVQQLYEEMEQQLRQEKQQLQAESKSRDLALSSQMQEALEAKERETQQLVEGQRELEVQIHELSASQQYASSEQQQLREAESDLARQLEEVQGQLRVTRRHLTTAKGRVSWQTEEKPRNSGAGEKAAAPRELSPVETPLPGVFEDNDDWEQLLSSFGSTPQGALQICWSPPPSPAGSPAPRVVRQISISEAHALPCAQGPSSEPPGVTSRAQEGEGRDPPEHDSPRELEGEPGPDPEPHSNPGAPTKRSGSLVSTALRVLVPVKGGTRPHRDRDEAPSETPVDRDAPPSQTPVGPGEQVPATLLDDRDPASGPALAKPIQLRETVPQHPPSKPRLGHPGPAVLMPGLAGPSLDVLGDLQLDTEGPRGQEDHAGEQTDPQGRTRREGLEQGVRVEERDGMAPRGQHLSSKQGGDTQGLNKGYPEHLQPAPLPSDGPPTQAESEDHAPRKPDPLRGSPPQGAQPGDEVGSQEITPRLPTAAESESPPRPPRTAADAGDGGSSESRRLGTESQPEDPRMGGSPGESGPTPPPASARVTNPDYVFHVIFLGDSNVGKTSFLHLLYHDSFPAGLTATVGVDFRVKNVLVDNKIFALQLWDTAGQERYHSVAQHLLRKADAAVLMYDITSQDSFSHVRSWLGCLQDAGCDGVAILLLGNKTDCEEARQVPTEAGQQLAQELGASFGECSAALGHNILEPMVSLARSLRVQEDRLKGSLVEVAPTPPPRRAGCCS